MTVFVQILMVTYFGLFFERLGYFATFESSWVLLKSSGVFCISFFFFLEKKMIFSLHSSKRLEFLYVYISDSFFGQDHDLTIFLGMQN